MIKIIPLLAVTAAVVSISSFPALGAGGGPSPSAANNQATRVPSQTQNLNARGFGPQGQPRITPGPDDPKTIEEGKAQIQKLEKRIRELIGDEIDYEVMNKKIADLMDHRERVRIVIAGKRAREELLQNKISGLSREAKAQISNDAILQELQRIAKLAEEKVARMQPLVQNKLASNEELQKTITEAAEATVRAEERREAIATNIGGGILATLQKELLSVSLDLTEQMAVMQQIEERAGEIREAMRLIEKSGHLSYLMRQMEFDRQNPR